MSLCCFKLCCFSVWPLQGSATTVTQPPKINNAPSHCTTFPTLSPLLSIVLYGLFLNGFKVNLRAQLVFLCAVLRYLCWKINSLNATKTKTKDKGWFDTTAKLLICNVTYDKMPLRRRRRRTICSAQRLEAACLYQNKTKSTKRTSIDTLHHT